MCFMQAHCSFPIGACIVISAVVPTQNRPVLLREAISSLISQSMPPSEIVVVDDGSSPPVDARALRAEFGSSVDILRNDRPKGLAYSRNRGVEESQGLYVVHLDDDDLLAETAIENAIRAFQADSSLELAFLGVKGFGARADYFNRVQTAAVAKAVDRAAGKRPHPTLVSFDARLMDAMLKAVPSAFQHVVAPRHVWERVTQLRWKAYQLSSPGSDIVCVKEAITGQLRDSEWALYAAATCRNTVLLDAPYYLARCDGQGMSSRPENKERHLHQNILIKTQLVRATCLPELTPWRAEARKSLANTHFDSAYYFLNQANRRAARPHAARAVQLHPMPKHLKTLVRTLLP